MPDDQQTQSTKIAELEKHQAVTDVKLDNINQGLIEIKTNHLVHINDNLTILNKSVADLPLEFTKMIAAEMSKVYLEINAIKNNDAKQQPAFDLGKKVVEYVILAVVGALLAFVIIK